MLGSRLDIEVESEDPGRGAEGYSDLELGVCFVWTSAVHGGTENGAMRLLLRS